MKRKASWAPTSASGKRAHVHAGVGEDADGDLGLEEQAARQAKTRRGRVMTEGYDSEDSDEEPSTSHRQQWKEGEKKDDEDDDMFGDSEPTETEATSSKEPRFLKLSEIDGQEFGARTQMDDDEDDEIDHEEDPEYEFEQSLKSTQFRDANAEAERTPPGSPGDGASSVNKRGMGYRIEKFNMKAEMASGQFDEDGNYIRNARDQFSQNDRWLEGQYNKKTIKAASEAQRRREQAEQARQQQEESEFPTMEHAMKSLALHMQPGETVLDTLQRLGKEATNAKKTGAHGQEAQASFDQFTHISSVLMSSFGQMNIYDEVYEGLVRMVRRAKIVPDEWDPARPRVDESDTEELPAPIPQEQWEYKWTPSYLAQAAKAQGTSVDPETKVFGPFSQADLCAWADQGYFGAQKENIAVRRVTSEGPASWTAWRDAGLP
ncbi:hypothetical protein ACI68E_001195 [Malassezia pachydermatis]|uniref:Lin1-like protein n=1 Tax=Malassezia pachydermatis TaxID=77020 RepID=A0A0M9VN86_9BASI|nr:lin1-like protein [Malassezia pachydermatis]KOS13093.1 lin1-like protein [Malassezia pachydermatis]